MNPGSGSSGHAYGEASYWDNRYKQDPGPFDWYQKYVAMAPIFDLYLRRHQRVLLVGCGNSGNPSSSLVIMISWIVRESVVIIGEDLLDRKWPKILLFLE